MGYIAIGQFLTRFRLTRIYFAEYIASIVVDLKIDNEFYTNQQESLKNSIRAKKDDIKLRQADIKLRIYDSIYHHKMIEVQQKSIADMQRQLVDITRILDEIQKRIKQFEPPKSEQSLRDWNGVNAAYGHREQKQE